MRNFINYTLALSLICLIGGCNSDNDPETQDVPPAEPIELTLRQREKSSVDNSFSFRMFKEVSALATIPNTFFSPLSLNMALGMLYNGAAGDTRTEMAEVLGLADFTETEVNEYYQKMSQALLDIDPLTDISMANSIWYRSGYPVKQTFIDVNKKYFDAIVQALDFNRLDAADIINQWCAGQTKDRIKEIIESPIDPNVVMYLINALYFKSKWQYEFDKANTKQDDFSLAGNRTKKVNMMEQTTVLPYYADQNLRCVEMPFGNQAFSMVAILPGGDMDLDGLIDYLDSETWQNVVNNLWEQNIWLKLPRFKIECEIDLNNPVKNAGMKRIFGGGLNNISDGPLAVSNIKQKTFVEVNEEGAEAAAVTVIEIRESLVPGTPQQIAFFANRPFLYLIKEKSTGVILFIGRMDEPL